MDVKQYEWLIDVGKLTPAVEESSQPQQEPHRPSPTSKKRPERNPLQVLAGLPFLRNLHLAQVQKILRSCVVGSCGEGDRICAMDTFHDEMFILITGRLGVLAKDGTEAMEIDPVTTIGALGFITNRPHPIGLEAKEPSKILRLSRAKFDLVLRADPDLQTKVHQNIIEILADSLHNLRARVEGALAAHAPDSESST